MPASAVSSANFSCRSRPNAFSFDVTSVISAAVEIVSAETMRSASTSDTPR